MYNRDAMASEPEVHRLHPELKRKGADPTVQKLP